MITNHAVHILGEECRKYMALLCWNTEVSPDGRLSGHKIPFKVGDSVIILEKIADHSANCGIYKVLVTDKVGYVMMTKDNI